MSCIITGLFFHTNSLETFYVFRKYSEFIDLEISVCPGLYDNPLSYQDSYNQCRMQIAHICKKEEEFLENPILNILYKISYLLSIPGSNLKTLIIWKCIRTTNNYEEFNLENEDESNIKECEEYFSSDGIELIPQNRLEQLFKLTCANLIQEHRFVTSKIKECLKDINYQEFITKTITMFNKHTILNDNHLEQIGTYL